MSDKVALVAVERVIAMVRREVVVSEELITYFAESKSSTREEAREKILSSAVRLALKHAGNNESVASSALVVVNGRQNRLPQCLKLMRKHRLHIVEAAYEIKSELAASNVSLRMLCEFLDHTDGDVEGEAYQLKGLLEEIAMKSYSREQEWALHARIKEELSAGRLVESIVDEILLEMERIDAEYEEMRLARSRAYRGVTK